MTEKMEADEIAALIDRMVEQLPERCREVFKLSRYEEKTNKEIALQLGLSENTVRGQLHKAMKKFEKYFDGL